MNNDFENFLNLRDSVFVSMMEAAEKEVASSSITDSASIVAALLAAHIACCKKIISLVPNEFKDKWSVEFINGAKQVLSSKNDIDTLH